jgi:hypothetical protein
MNARGVLVMISLGACGPSSPGAPDGASPPGTIDAAAPRIDAPPPPPCASIEVDADVISRPIDIIVVVDTSPTMGPAVAQVEATINGAFASVIEAAGVDYRVILLASGVTIGPPLSTSGRLYTYDVATGSGNAYAVVGSTYGTWAGALRPDALKVFLWFTDSSSGEGPGQGAVFDATLLATDPVQFGTAGARNYLLHSIIGLVENSPPVAPWLPGDPVQSATCAGGGFPTGPGEGFQELSVLTGGLRFPICQFAYFDAVFQTLADAVISGAAVPCEFDLPAPPPGETLDLESIELVYTSGGSMETLTQVMHVGQCFDGGFFVEGDRIRLCPGTCTRVSADPAAEIDIRFDCATPVP